MSQRQLRILAGKAATREILDLMMGTGKAHYRDFMAFASISSLNQRLRDLEKYGLIQHHISKKEKREEWYTITEAGEEYRRKLHDMDELEENSNGKNK